MKLLVTGAAKSGTRFIAAELERAGVRVRHEQAFTYARQQWFRYQQAEVSWQAAPFTPILGVHTVHLVRNPLQAVRSAYLARVEWDERGLTTPAMRHHEAFIAEHCDLLAFDPDRPFAREASAWVGWNRLVRAHERLRLEDIDAEALQRLARVVVPDATVWGLGGPVGAHETHWDPLSWSDIDVPGMLDLAEEYGYR